MYRELAEEESDLKTFKSRQRWKQDPDANKYGGVFAPRARFFINGVFVDEEKPKPAVTSKTPFPEPRVPRRGLLQVFPDDPEYARLCIEQGLGDLVNGHRDQSHPINGVQSPPASHSAGTPTGHDGSSETAHQGDSKSTPDGTRNGPNGSLPNGVDRPTTTAS